MSQSKALSKPTFIKVKQLENLRNGYNVYVKVVSAEHSVIETREGLKIPKVDCVVADQTASAKAFFKGDNANLIQKGNVIAIRNGVVRLNKNHISLEVDLFGRVTLEKDITVNPTQALDISSAEHKYPERRGNDRRQGDRPRNNNYRGDRGNRGQPRREDDRPPRRQRENREGTERREGGNRRQGADRQNRNNRSYNREQRVDRRRDQPRQDRRNYNRDYDRREDRQVREREDRQVREREDRQVREREDRQVREREYRPRNNYTEKREDNRGDRKPLNWTKIADILPGDDNLNINVKIISLTKVGNNKYRLVVGDATGISNAFLPNRIDLREGDSVVLFGARAEVVKEHIELQLVERGRIEISKKPVDKINEEFNLSSKAWVPIE